MIECALDKVSVVVPFYNRSRFFERLITGIEAQTRHPDKVFIVDNGSRSEEIQKIWPIIRDTELNVTLISTLRTGNANFARNLGFDLADDGFVAFLDSDDWWESKHIEQSIKKLSLSHARAVYSGAYILGEEERLNESVDVNTLKTPFDLFFSKNGYIAQTSSYVVKKNNALIPVYWDENFRRHQDYDYFLAIWGTLEGWCFLDEVNVNYDMRQGEEKNIDPDCLVPFIEKWKEFFPRKMLKNYLFGTIILYEKRKKPENADYFKKMYLDNFGVIKSLLISSPVIHMRFFLIRVMDYLRIKTVIRKVVRLMSR